MTSNIERRLLLQLALLPSNLERMADKKLAKKLAKMSEEERAEFLEQQRLQEEEMQRKKEEMLSRFLKVGQSLFLTYERVKKLHSLDAVCI